MACYWCKHPIGARKFEERIKLVHRQSKCCYGSNRIAAELKMQGILASRPRTRLMRLHLISSIILKRCRVQTTDSNHACTVAVNYLSSNFSEERLAQKWVSDLTYLRTWEGWLYLTAVLNQASTLTGVYSTPAVPTAGKWRGYR
ncbi:IS3 family transposase [Rufibacter sp. XAAS-G3-1]|uniref:IS3 family transposase n=1 Tax=Rufibacter sp. XAAS-G3-1 TaxID=2729134 RepID=UPI00351A75A5